MEVTSIFFEKHFELVAVVKMEGLPWKNVQKMEYPQELQRVVISIDEGKYK